MEKIRVIIKRAGEAGCHEKHIDNSLEALQRIAGGHIECVGIEPGMIVICDEEGRIKEKPYNCTVSIPERSVEVDFFGDIFFTGTKGEELASLPDSVTEEMVSSWIADRDKANDTADEFLWLFL